MIGRLLARCLALAAAVGRARRRGPVRKPRDEQLTPDPAGRRSAGDRTLAKRRGLRTDGPDAHLARAEHVVDQRGHHLLRALAHFAGAKFSTDDAGRVLCRIRGVTAIVQGLEDIWILHEIFVVGVYHLIDEVATEVRPVVVWDIGMNVGLASLYFAMRPGVAAVVGHEPLAPTYRAALDNLRLNPSAARKIAALDYGVGGTGRTEVVDYCLPYKGSVGLRGLVGDPARRRAVLGIDETNTMFTREELTMRAAGDVLASIRAAHPGVPVVAKIDCEGAEYEIIDAFHRDGALPMLDAVMMEWHRDGPGRLCARLEDAGFAVSRADRPDTEGLGMIYAVRSHPTSAGAGGP